MFSRKLRRNEWINALTWVCKRQSCLFKNTQSLSTKRTTVGLFVCFSSFSFGRAWFKRGSLDPRKSKSENSNIFLYAVWGWLVHSVIWGKQELPNFPEKDVKIVLGKERVFAVMWTHIPKVIRDPKPQNWGWILDGHPPLWPCSSVSSGFPGSPAVPTPGCCDSCSSRSGFLLRGRAPLRSQL